MADFASGNQAENPSEKQSVIRREIEEEMKASYLDYAMSVLVSRALPDVRDGLKPVQRRILFAMLDLGLQHNKPYKKSARIVGEAMGKYHPHGDLAVYEALVRMAQGFSLRYPLVDGQGNFGCFTKDTKVRLTNGRSLSFEELIKEQRAGKRHWTFSFNGKIEIAEIRNPRLTRKNAELAEVALDNGEKVKCTPDHRFMSRDGSYQEAVALQPSDSLMPFSALVEEAKAYNHKAVNVLILKEREDVYDLTVEPWHNFLLDAGVFVHNSVDGDSAAAQRYTEARMSSIAELLLEDLDKETVDFVKNFDGSLEEPVVLPSKFPNLLVNGSSGIAVGMATNIPPHNLKEVSSAVAAVVKNPSLPFEELVQLIPGPDFPTGGIIYGTDGIREAYSSGKGIIRVRAKTFFEHKKERMSMSMSMSIVVSEISYQLNKSQLVEELAELVRAKVVTGVEDIRDESDREGIRIVIDLKKDASPDVVLNQLMVHSKLETSFPIALVALVGRVPRLVTLREAIDSFVQHRREVVRRRTSYLLRNAKEKAHLLEGLLVALNNVDAVVKLIRSSEDKAAAKASLTLQFPLSDKQAEAVLDMKLQRLVSLEQQSIADEHKQLLADVANYSEILASEAKVSDIIVSEISEMAQQYGDERRTMIVEAGEELVTEDIVKPEDVVVTITHAGYIKRIGVDAYRQQRRGGKGIIAAATREGDFVESIFVANTHSYMLFFTSLGIVHWLKVYEVPEASRYASGKAVVNLLHLRDNEKITAFIPVKEFTSGNLVMITKKGAIKKTELSAYSNPRRGGIIAISLDEGDELITVALTSGNRQLIVATKNGLAVRFNEQDVRAVGRSAKGVRAIRLRQDDAVVGMVVANEPEALFTITANGFGKRSPVSDYRLISRGGSGVINIQTTDRNGPVAAIASVTDNDDIIVISSKGNIIRIAAKDISIISRNTQGVRLMRLEPGDSVVSIAKVPKETTNGTNGNSVVTS